MLRLPPEAIEAACHAEFQRKGWSPESVNRAIADAATRHCLEKVREFLKDWVSVPSKMSHTEFDKKYHTKTGPGTVLHDFDAWLSHEGISRD